MEGSLHKGWWIWPYATMLYTRSPLLHEIYCESHRLEPWAVRGEASRYGHYAFPNVLYVAAEERSALLTEIGDRLSAGPDYAFSVIDRYSASARRLLERIRAARRAARPSAALADELVEEACRVLSSGVFKEALEPTQAEALLARDLPAGAIRDRLLMLYQPLCLPHFLKFELKVLAFAERWCLSQDRRAIAGAIAHAAHLSRFFLEDAPLADPEAMRAELERAIERCGGDPEALRSERRRRLDEHQRAVRDSLAAERDILARMDKVGRYSLATKSTVAALLRFIQFIATLEELKHILTVEAAKALRGVLDRAGLAIESTGRRELLAALG
jgi:hypothetical protein